MKPALTFKEAEFWLDFIAELIHLEASKVSSCVSKTVKGVLVSLISSVQ